MQEILKTITVSVGSLLLLPVLAACSGRTVGEPDAPDTTEETTTDDTVEVVIEQYVDGELVNTREVGRTDVVRYTGDTDGTDLIQLRMPRWVHRGTTFDVGVYAKPNLSIEAVWYRFSQASGVKKRLAKKWYYPRGNTYKSTNPLTLMHPEGPVRVPTAGADKRVYVSVSYSTIQKEVELDAYIQPCFYPRYVGLHKGRCDSLMRAGGGVEELYGFPTISEDQYRFALYISVEDHNRTHGSGTPFAHLRDRYDMIPLSVHIGISGQVQKWLHLKFATRGIGSGTPFGDALFWLPVGSPKQLRDYHHALIDVSFKPTDTYAYISYPWTYRGASCPSGEFSMRYSSLLTLPPDLERVAGKTVKKLEDFSRGVSGGSTDLFIFKEASTHWYASSSGWRVTSAYILPVIIDDTAYLFRCRSTKGLLPDIPPSNP